MNEAINRGFFLALGVHVVFFVALGAFVFIEFFKEEEPEPLHVFEMVSSPGPPAPETPLETPAEAPVPKLPDLQPTPEVNLREVEIVEPEPEPEPVPEVTPEPEPVPEVESEPEPRQVSADDFFRQHGPAQPREQPRPRPREIPRPRIDAPRLDPSSITRALDSIVVEAPGTSGSRSANDQRALYDYIARLRAQIEARWERPSTSGDDELSVIIRLEVAPNGRITGARILQSSGNALFDQSALRASRSVPGVGPTPEGKRYTFDQPFTQVRE